MNTPSPKVALAQLQSALERTELDLNFQALIRLTEDPLQHYEVRCSLEADESCPPTRFLFETAAENALGEQLDRRILEQLMRRLSTCADPGQLLVVNMSHNSLVSIHFLRWLEERIGNNPDIASKLVFQISETDALIAQHHLIPFCEAINKLGCGLSVSNFGCTPKPMRYLSLVPANLVKLDTTLLHKIEASQTNLTNLVSLIEELHAREIKVVAPMLERLAILPLLWRAGVDFMQGNCLHSPASSMNYPILKARTINHANSA